MSQSHAVSIGLREPANSGVTPTLVAGYLVKSGSDWTLSPTGPAQGRFIDVEQDGNYRGFDLTTPLYLVQSAGDWIIDAIGPATGVLVDVGDGTHDLVISTDLTQPPAADVRREITGDHWIVPRNCPSLDAVTIGVNTLLY